ncbi:BTAD domain-containing putative transcriptional regulator [Streptomyces sp. NPDC059894]|uniref:AfsR/SARP family transcriptional regulator n=1 Tax=unclassified Streptomyces TaxID=2593676 RepID=UPI0036495687
MNEPGAHSPRLRLLGPVALIAERGTLDVGPPRLRVVLAVLALNANRVTPVEKLVDALWEEAPPSTARGQIQVCISALRKLLDRAGAPGIIKTRPPGYLLELAPDQLDTERFALLVALAGKQAEAGRLTDAAATLREALRLWHGPALAGVRSSLVQRSAALLEESRLTALERRITLDLALGLHGQVTGELYALCAEHPGREGFRGLLMLALYRCGRQVEALAVARAARQFLIDEVGIEPGLELRELERAVLHQDPGLHLSADQLPPDLAAEPDTTGGTPPPAEPNTAPNTAPNTWPGADEPPCQVPHLLPASIADFTGRQAQLTRIERLLTEDPHPYAVRIVAICGKAGVGKSSLAVRVAHQLGDAFPDGHLYADMGSGRGDEHTSRLLGRFLRALGVEGSAVPDDLTERAEMYRSRLANKRILVLLDEVADEEQVLPMLPGSPTCAVIVTGRTRLGGLSGWHRVDVGVLDTDESIELLARIVGERRIRAERDAAVELAGLCGGLPLALRIAGARLESRPDHRIGALVRRLADESRRLDEFTHQGLALRSSIDAAYRELNGQARRLLRLCTLMPSPHFPGWTAATLLDIGPRQAQDLLESLVDAQLLDTVTPLDTPLPHYCLHDLIRLYAQEQLTLTESEEDRRATLGRVLRAWLALARQWHRELHGQDYTTPEAGLAEAGTVRWAPERSSLIAAIRLAAETGFHELYWDLVLTSAGLFERGGYLDEWHETTRLALAATERARNHRVTSAMLYSAGRLYVRRQRLREAEHNVGAALSERRRSWNDGPPE